MTGETPTTDDGDVTTRELVDDAPMGWETLSADEGVRGELPAVERPTGRSTAIFATWTGLSRVAGLAREILAAALFGTFTLVVSTIMVEVTGNRAAPGFWLMFAAYCSAMATAAFYRGGRQTQTEKAA